MSSPTWKLLPGYDDIYEVSSSGDVRSLGYVSVKGRQVPGRTLKLTNHAGYLVVSLYQDGARHTREVHSLVALTFLGERPEGLEVCHNNGDDTDNRVVNLRYDTSASNSRDTVRHGKHVHASKTHCSQGHAFNEVNTRTHVSRTGRARNCRVCNREIKRRSLKKLNPVEVIG